MSHIQCKCQSNCNCDDIMEYGGIELKVNKGGKETIKIITDITDIQPVMECHKCGNINCGCDDIMDHGAVDFQSYQKTPDTVKKDSIIVRNCQKVNTCTVKTTDQTCKVYEKGVKLPIVCIDILNNGIPNGDAVFAVANYGQDIYFGGRFALIEGIEVNNIAKWNSITREWSALGDGLNDTVVAMVFDDNGNLYVGGTFTNAGGDPNADSIAKWDGSTWSNITPNGAAFGGCSSLIFDLNGDLYAGGSFALIDGVAAVRIAKWDGTTWTPLGSGANSSVLTLEVDSQNNLYAGGFFTSMGGVANTNRIAKWDGTVWTPLNIGLNSYVNTIAVDLNDVIYAGGVFTNADGDPNADRIAQFDGTSWSAVGDGLNSTVNVIKFDSNGLLHIGGNFSASGSGQQLRYLATWDGLSYSQYDSNLSFGISDLVFDPLNNLYIGGSFDNSDIGFYKVLKYTTGINVSAPEGQIIQDYLNSLPAGLFEITIGPHIIDRSPFILCEYQQNLIIKQECIPVISIQLPISGAETWTGFSQAGKFVVDIKGGVFATITIKHTTFQ